MARPLSNNLEIIKAKDVPRSFSEGGQRRMTDQLQIFKTKVKVRTEEDQIETHEPLRLYN